MNLRLLNQPFIRQPFSAAAASLQFSGRTTRSTLLEKTYEWQRQQQERDSVEISHKERYEGIQDLLRQFPTVEEALFHLYQKEPPDEAVFLLPPQQRALAKQTAAAAAEFLHKPALTHLNGKTYTNGDLLQLVQEIQERHDPLCTLPGITEVDESDIAHYDATSVYAGDITGLFFDHETGDSSGCESVEQALRQLKKLHLLHGDKLDETSLSMNIPGKIALALYQASKTK